MQKEVRIIYRKIPGYDSVEVIPPPTEKEHATLLHEAGMPEELAEYAAKTLRRGDLITHSYNIVIPASPTPRR